MTFQAQIKKELIAKGIAVTSLTTRRDIAVIRVTNLKPSQKMIVKRTLADLASKLTQDKMQEIQDIFWDVNITYTSDLRQKAFEFMQSRFENYKAMSGTLADNLTTFGNSFWVVQEVTQLLDGRLSFAELSKEFWAQN